jgi:iron(III) transport system permease protein
LRAGAVGGLGVAGGLALRRLPLSTGPGRRELVWVLLLAPFVTPSLLPGYAYSNLSLALIRHPLLNELLYAGLLLLKLAPVAAAVLFLAPSFVSDQALHCRRLLRERRGAADGPVSYVRFLAHGPLRAWAVAFGLVFLLAFSEFEVASLFGIRRTVWTVPVFEEQAGGLALWITLGMIRLPVACEFAVLLFVFAVLATAAPGPGLQVLQTVGRAPFRTALGWCLAAFALLAVTLVPAAVVLRGGILGAATVARDLAFAREVGAGLLLGLGAAACAYLGAGWFCRRAVSSASGRVGRLAAALAVSVPGLTGALVLSLVAVAVFSRPVARRLYDTPVPLLGVLALLLLPLALLLRLLLDALRPASDLHVASLLAESRDPRVRRRRRRLVWELIATRSFWAVFLLFCLAYFDLTASAVLCPSGMTTATVRLYNLMHYGRTPMLSAMVCFAFAVPVMMMMLAGGAGRLLARWGTHE